METTADKINSPKEQTEADSKDEGVDKSLFTKSGGMDTLALSRTLSSKKAMKREYVPKTIIQFLRERKSFHENHEQLHKHMRDAHKLLSPAAFTRQTSSLMNCPDLVLDPEAKQGEQQGQSQTQWVPFIIAVCSNSSRLWEVPIQAKLVWSTSSSRSSCVMGRLYLF